VHILGEAAVQFDVINGQGEQIAKVGVAGAKVIVLLLKAW